MDGVLSGEVVEQTKPTVSPDEPSDGVFRLPEDDDYAEDCNRQTNDDRDDGLQGEFGRALAELREVNCQEQEGRDGEREREQPERPGQDQNDRASRRGGLVMA